MSTNLISGRTGNGEIVIVLEVPCHVTSKSKLSPRRDRVRRRAEHAVSLAMPHAGMPAGINRFLRRAGGAPRGSGSRPRSTCISVFDRNNYFYADLPAGYQISQYKQPVVGEGSLVIDLEDGTSKSIGIERLHLEQDAGKSLHDQTPPPFVDLNRAGVALMEIVSKPDLRSADRPGSISPKLRSILRYLGTCDGDMEKGRPARRRQRFGAPRRRDRARHALRDQERDSIRYIKQAV